MKTLLLLLFCILSMHSNAQEESWIEVRPKLGFLIAHRSIMGHVVDEHAVATEFSYYFKGNGERYWHEPYNNPRYGVSGFVGTVGNRDLFGIYYGAYGFMSMPLIHTKRFTFSGRLGAGLSVAPKVYHHETNNLSIATSTHVNALVSMAVESRYEIGPHAVNAIIDMTHFSNGAAKVPNLGLNVPFVSLGYGYRIREAQIEIVPRFSDVNPKYWEFGAVGVVSVKEVYPVGGKKYPCFGVNLMGRRYFRPQVGMEVSLDFMYKSSLQTYAPDVPMTIADQFQMGIFVGYLMPFYRFHIITGMGYYLRDKYGFQEPVYHRVGMRYVFKNGLNINCVLKSHWARADYVEYGIGYTFKR
ncbi:MAG: hypothetical protein DCO96_14965 [Fluviicola sp. XM-24bin1]|nr:MAG: hypothetical protein DCO96_14965 [Fluviicola sp. XM-24bin1]